MGIFYVIPKGLFRSKSLTKKIGDFLESQCQLAIANHLDISDHFF